MKKISSIIVIVASLGMLACFRFPLWDINLEAPQYPEGLEMTIWIDHLGGQVEIINELNHYIGMKHIKAEMFPELSYMKNIIKIFVITGIIVALIRRKGLYGIWFLAFLGVAALGIYDFWHWEYDYGHNLDPHAAINIPGMVYQPPLIGCKQLLNFNACSFPSTGGIIIMTAGSLCFIIFVYELFFHKKVPQKNSVSKVKGESTKMSIAG
jgi:copper chaperone NosL